MLYGIPARPVFGLQGTSFRNPIHQTFKKANKTAWEQPRSHAPAQLFVTCSIEIKKCIKMFGFFVLLRKAGRAWYITSCGWRWDGRKCWVVRRHPGAQNSKDNSAKHISMQYPRQCIDNWVQRTGLEMRIYGLECRFRQKCTRLSQTLGVKLYNLPFGHTPVQDWSNSAKGEPQNSPRVVPEVWHQRSNSHSIR